MQTYDALILAGGQGRRLGGVDKASLVVGGNTLLDRALSAVAGAERIVVVGRPASPLPPGIRVASEDPPGGGPVAGIAAGMVYVESRFVVILACDMPLMTASVVDRLVARLVEASDEATGATRSAGVGMPDERTPPDGVNLVDDGGHPQPLAAAYRTAALRLALRKVGTQANASMRQLLSHLTISELPADARTTLDCDTWSDVERCRELLTRNALEQ